MIAILKCILGWSCGGSSVVVGLAVVVVGVLAGYCWAWWHSGVVNGGGVNGGDSLC